MSQAGSIDDGGGSGSDLQQLTPNDGIPVVSQANNIDVLGVASGSAQVVETSNSTGLPTGNFLVENRAHVTAYVVDPSTTVGERGTFSTVQSAINAVAADAVTPFGVILLRPGIYTENLSFPAGGFQLWAPTDAGNTASGATAFIVGTMTIAAGSSVVMQGVSQSGAVSVAATGQLIANSSSLGNITSAGGLSLDDCTTGTITSSALVTCLDSIVGNVTLTGGPAESIFRYSSLGNVSVADNVSIVISNCYRVGLVTGTTAGEVKIFNSGMSGVTPINASANTHFAGLYEQDNGTVLTSFFGSNPTLIQQQSMSANVLNVRRVAGNIVATVNDFVVAVTDTSVARTVTLPSTGVLTNQKFIIKDESLAAGTNNITVSVNGGVKTIDGQLTQVINSNGGSFTAYYNGTNYFIL